MTSHRSDPKAGVKVPASTRSAASQALDREIAAGDRPLARGEPRSPGEPMRETRTAVGEHPVGTTVGAVAGAAAAGAAVGGFAGPVGTAIGAAAGAVAGAAAGHRAADAIDPMVEDAYWRSAWRERAYIAEGTSYEDDYAPAYRYGVEAYLRYPERNYDDLETDLSAGWKAARGRSRIDWERARPAARDAWQRLRDAAERAAPGDADGDGR